MVILGIETSTRVCSAGLAGPDGFIAEYRIRGGNVREERLAQTVSVLLRDAGLSAERVDGVAVSIGPGSFTGLRIGLGFAKGWALGSGKPLAAVPTPDAVASRVPVTSPRLCVLLIAKKEEVYRAVYRREDGAWISAGPADAVPESGIVEDFSGEETIFVGEGVTGRESMIKSRLKHAVFMPALLSVASGCAVAMLGRILLSAGKASDIRTLVPRYQKRFQGVE
jgi:tRNA threonylcarbamoyladenosine biosynthesis protein TsaB